MNVSATSDGSPVAARTFSAASNRKPTDTGRNRKERLPAWGKAESPCLKDVSRKLTLSISWLFFLCVPYIFNRLPLYAGESCSWLSHLYLLPAWHPSGKKSTCSSIVKGKTPGLRFFGSDWPSLGHVSTLEPIPAARTVERLKIRMGHCPPVGPFQQPGLRGRRAFSQRNIQILIPDSGCGWGFSEGWTPGRQNQWMSLDTSLWIISNKQGVTKQRNFLWLTSNI